MLTARLATPEDLSLVRSITIEAYREYATVLDRDPLPVTEDYAPRIAAGQVWLVSRDSADAGLAVLETEPDHLLIFSLAVLPEARGGGVGRWMLGFAERRARTAGVPEIRLYTNPKMLRNIQIYTQAGYVETSRTPNPYRPGWLIVNMAKPI